MTLLYAAGFMFAIGFVVAACFFLLAVLISLVASPPPPELRVQVENPRDPEPLDIAPAIARERKTRVTTIPKERR